MSSPNIRKIWQDIASFTCHESDNAMLHFLEQMKLALKASNIAWVGSAKNKDHTSIPVAEMLGDWFTVDLLRVQSNNDSLAPESICQLYMEMKQKYGIDPFTKAAIQGAGESRSLTRREVISDDEWQGHWVNQEFHHKNGDSEVMIVVCSVDPECESHIIFYREIGAKPFNSEEREIAFTASMGIAPLHRRMMKLRGATLPCKRLLSQQERTVLSLLLQGMREKEISLALEISQGTVHKHVTSIYRKFGVSGKFDLMAVLM